ncbi:hypothetical protein FF38_05000 [Lucilia cuprina]|uniref:Uncharacterized protein n=1 Tax=Lucilia cuprina TaxID=7375 RepID=A0A0L0CJM3_LUCCU|nr:hypothetical protein FF38_05000 [Lucilia cuprina]
MYSKLSHNNRRNALYNDYNDDINHYYTDKNVFVGYSKIVSQQQDEVAEWLRRWTANPMCSARVGSNPILVENVATDEVAEWLRRWTANPMCSARILIKKIPTRMGFEPTRAEHIGLAVQRLNHSATSSYAETGLKF